MRVQIAVLAAMLFAGCATPSPAAPLEASSEAIATKPVVIAVLDSGTNPYLPVFSIKDDEAIRNVVAAPFTDLTLTATGSIKDRREADDELLRSLDLGRLYHVNGTRLFSVSFGHFDAPPMMDGSDHGAVTTYLAAVAAPDAIIVSVQIDGRMCRQDTSCFANPSIASGMEWIADQAWIDVVSVSMNMPASLPDPSAVHEEAGRFVRASERAAREGKIIVNSAGNYLVPPNTDYFGGPPWVIAVGGVEADAKGHSLLSSKAADVVSNFTTLGPERLSDKLGWKSGTSMATPIVAGTLAHALHLIRVADPARVVVPGELRDALNASGTYFEPAQWDPRPSDRGPFLFAYAYTASLPVLTQAQMGWGYVDAALAGEIARRVLENDLEPPAAKAQATRFQAHWQKAREEHWSRAADGSRRG